MADPGASSGTSTATLRLTIGELKIVHPITVPNRTVQATEIVPALQDLVNAVVAAAEVGKTASCRKGCGACCRQLVPVSRSEGERLLQLIDEMPAARREQVRARFAAAERLIEQAGLVGHGAKTDRELSTAYFALRVACPFLEDESCSIHPERPLVCREYLVTSPAAFCAGPVQEGVTPLAVPKISMAARKLQEEGDGWFPLAMLLAWARTRPRNAQKRPGMEWIQRFVQRLSVR